MDGLTQEVYHERGHPENSISLLGHCEGFNDVSGTKKDIKKRVESEKWPVFLVVVL